MPEFRSSVLWTGRGEPLCNAIVHTDQSGRIIGIEEGASFPEPGYRFGMPSFVDAHCHYSWMVLKEMSVNLSGVGSSGEMLEVLASSMDHPSVGGVLRGESFDQSLWSDPRLPSLKELDSVTGRRPVFLCRVCGHFALANSALLELFSEESPFIHRERGILTERAVMDFSSRFPPDPSLALEAAFQVAANMHSAGVTGVLTMEKPENAVALHSAGLPLDVVYALQMESASDSGHVPVPSGFIKLFLDGSIGAFNAAVPEFAPGNLIYSDRALLDILLECGETGVTPAFHAIGCDALAQLDRVSAEAFSELGKGFPVRVEHAEDLIPAWPGNWDPLHHIFSMQPNFVHRWQRAGGMYDAALGESRASALNPFRTVLEAGFKLGFGSDSMPFDPLYGLQGALDHRDSAQSLDLFQALEAYTLSAAAISSLEEDALPLKAGRPANMVFLTEDPRLGLAGIGVEATVRLGETVYRKGTE